MKNKIFGPVCAALAASFFWSFSFIWFKIANLGYGPLTIITIRLALSAVIVFATAKLLGYLQKPSKKDVWLFVLMAFFEPFLYFVGESYGLLYISSTVAAVIVSTIPIISPIVAWFFFRERLSFMNVIGLLISFIGVGLVVLTKGFKLNAPPIGVGLEFIAVLAAISYSVVLRKLSGSYNSFTIIAWQNFIGAIFFLPLWLTFEFDSFTKAPFHPQAFRAILFLTIFSSILAFMFFTKSIRELGITRSNIFVNLIPVFVAILSYFVLKDTLEISQITGIAVVVAGLFFAQIKRRHKETDIDDVEIITQRKG